MADGTEKVRNYYRTINGKRVPVEGYARRGDPASGKNSASLKSRIKRLTDGQLSKAIMLITKQLSKLDSAQRSQAIVFIKALQEERKLRQGKGNG